MHVMNHLEIREKITSDSLSDDGIRGVLYEAFGYNSVLSREEQLRKDRPELVENLSKIPDEYLVADRTFAENRIRYFQQDFFSRFKGTRAEKLLYLASKISRYPCFNEQPRALLDIAAPEFFKMFPQGEIWFVKFSEKTLSAIWEGERSLRKIYNPDSTMTLHEMSGLEGGLSIYYWLNLMMYCFYPFVNGVISTGDAQLIFLFFPDKAINSLKEYKFDLYRATELDYSDVYRDGIISPARPGPKSFFPADAAVLSIAQSYFEWYIDRCNRLIDELLDMQDLRRRFISTLTLNRLAIDTRIIETSEVPYLMKILFFGVLDKLANLYVQLGIESSETTVWKTFLTMGFYESMVKDVLYSIPGHFGDIIRNTAEWIFEELETFGPCPEIMRELRNSYHGYGLRNIDMLLSHSGELNNDVPRLSNILWHWLLCSGLPKEKLSS